MVIAAIHADIIGCIFRMCKLFAAREAVIGGEILNSRGSGGEAGCAVHAISACRLACEVSER